MTARNPRNAEFAAHSDPVGPRRRTGPTLLTVREAADVQGCSATNVYGLIEAGELPVIMVGRSRGYRIAESDLNAFVDQRRTRKEGKKPVRPVSRPRLKHIKL